MPTHLRHLAERIPALLLVQAVAGAHDRELLGVDAAVVGGVLEVEHKVHVSGRKQGKQMAHHRLAKNKSF